MKKIKKWLWFSLGMFCVGMAYIGVVTPGIPFSIFLVIAAFSFSKSSDRMHKWLFNHKYFGPFLTNWGKYRVFPLYAKYTMVTMMSISLAIMWVTLHNPYAPWFIPPTIALWSGLCMIGVAVWGWRYPSSKEEHDYRKKAGLRIAWLK